MPMLPSSSRALAQRPAPGNAREHGSPKHRRTTHAREVQHRFGDVDAERGDPAAKELGHVAPGAATDVEHRAARLIQHVEIRSLGVGEPPL